MWIQIRDIELELDEEKRRHSETIKILRKKERQVKEVLIQSEEDQKNISLLQESLDKISQRVSIYKRQLQEQVSWSTPSFSASVPHLPSNSRANFTLNYNLLTSWPSRALTNYLLYI
jgi:Tfp pilus assembly protein PilO